MKRVADYVNRPSDMFRDLAELTENERLRRIWRRNYERLAEV